MTPFPLPPPPDFLWVARVARRVRAALEELHRCCDITFAQVFGSQKGGAAPRWREECPSKIDALLKVGLLKDSVHGILSSDYLITPWEGAFYVTDFPERGKRDEVFAPFPETRFFSTLLQARPGDSVLDLGTGSGILLLEAARRGATGLGIDCSERALAFARANAVLNGLEAQVRFERGDMTQPPVGDAWGKPTLVLSNPPFEPVPDDPGALSHPLHSDGGPYGDTVVKKMLEVLAQWSHRPALIQCVLFSLGRAATHSGEPIHLMDRLANTACALGALLELHELLKPLRLKDFVALAWGGGPRAAQQWLALMKAEGFQTLHLLFANLYLSTPLARSQARVGRWIPYANSRQNDECFLWALASPKRVHINLGAAGEADISARHVGALIEAREEMLAGQPIDLSFQDARTREYIHRLLGHDTLFNGNEPLVLISLQQGSTGGPLAHSVVTVTQKGAVFEPCPLSEFRALVERRFDIEGQLTQLGAIKCDVFSESRSGEQKVNADENKYLKWDIDVGDWSEVISGVLTLPEGSVQRLAVLSASSACLSPMRQRFFANFLSELAGIAAMGRAKSYELLQDAAFVFGHDLKNQLDELGHGAVRLALRHNEPSATERVEACLQKLDILYGTVEIFRVLTKFISGQLPREWGQRELIADWPARFDASVHLQPAAEACRIVIRQSVTPYVMELQKTGLDCRLREVNANGPTDVSPLQGITTIALPPLTNTPSSVPPYAVLAGLSEIVRNAMKAIVNNGTQIRHDYGGLHLDYAIRVGQDDICVTVWNPFVGQYPLPSETLARMRQLYRQLRAVQIEPAKPVYDYPFASAPQPYAQSKFILRPAEFQFLLS